MTTEKRRLARASALTRAYRPRSVPHCLLQSHVSDLVPFFAASARIRLCSRFAPELGFVDAAEPTHTPFPTELCGRYD